MEQKNGICIITWYYLGLSAEHWCLMSRHFTEMCRFSQYLSSWLFIWKIAQWHTSSVSSWNSRNNLQEWWRCDSRWWSGHGGKASSWCYTKVHSVTQLMSADSYFHVLLSGQCRNKNGHVIFWQSCLSTWLNVWHRYGHLILTYWYGSSYSKT